MANKILVKKSSVAAKVPLTTDLDYGELALNYTDGKLYYKTASNTIASIGSVSNVTVQIDKKFYTATAAQTTFDVTYDVAYVEVYINGVHLSDEDYTATSGTDIVLTIACSAGDQVDLVGFSGINSTIGIASGGTGQTTAQAAMNAFAGAVTSGSYLRGNGTNVVMSAIQVADVPTLNQNTTGSAETLTTGRTISVTGDISYTSPSFNGSASVTAAGTLATVNSNIGTFNNVTVNAKGLVTAASNVSYLPATRLVTIANATSITANADTTDIAVQANTQVAGTLTINAPTGTPVDGQKLVIRLSSTAVQTFSFNAIFTGSTDQALPTVSSSGGKYDYMGFQYNSTAAKWNFIAKNFGF
jgi:hypothetical protein